MQKGYKHTKEALMKMSEAARMRDNSNRIKALPKKEQHWNWSKKPNNLTLHKRIYRTHGKASDRNCVDCGKKARDWSNTGKYSDNIIDYVPRCRKCHIKKDKNWKKNKSENWKKLKRNKKGQFIKKT